MGQARWAVGALVAAVVIGAAGIGAAATPEETARARDSFLKGQAHFDLKEYDEALKNFRDAYRFAPDPVLLFNIAQCHAKLGQTDDALRFYRNYLRRAPQAANRGEVEKRIAELERDAAAAPKPPGPAPLTPPAATEPPVQTTPPFARPAPLAPAPPASAASTPAVSPPGPTSPPPVQVELPRLEPTPPLQLTAPMAPAPVDTESPPIYRRWWFWTGVAVVVAGGILSAVAVGRRGEVGDCRMLPNCRELR